MFTFAPGPELSQAERYEELRNAAVALTNGETDAIANMANLAALCWLYIPGLNWVGFYRVMARELVLGPFIGKPACIRIPLGQGVCGTAALSGETQLVPNVEEFPGHIACDADTRSELVVPIQKHGEVIAVIDLDSPIAARFTDQDREGIEKLVNAVSGRLG
jgi:GAF domain-containing protein